MVWGLLQKADYKQIQNVNITLPGYDCYVVLNRAQPSASKSVLLLLFTSFLIPETFSSAQYE